MPIRNPAHKQVIREQFDRPIHELGDYVKQVEDSEKRLEKKKLTFEEVVNPIANMYFGYYGYTDPITVNEYDDVELWRLIWKVAQENV